MTRHKSPNNTTSKVAPEYKSFFNFIPQLSHRVPKGFRALELRDKQCRALTIIGLQGSRAARRKKRGSLAPLRQTRVPFSQNQQFCAGGRQARKRKATGSGLQGRHCWAPGLQRHPFWDPALCRMYWNRRKNP